MAKEPENLVLQILRDIRATLDEHTRTLAEHSRAHAEHRQAFAEIREAISGANSNAAYAAGFAVLGRRDNDVTATRVNGLEARVKRLEEKVDG